MKVANLNIGNQRNLFWQMCSEKNVALLGPDSLFKLQFEQLILND
jgi:hypothetical protein